MTPRCTVCGGPRHPRPFAHVNTMEPRNAWDWAAIFAGALMAVFVLPLAAVVLLAVTR